MINARVDVFARRLGEPASWTDEAIRRGGMYLAAGADCVYPIMLSEPAAIGILVDAFDGRVNVYARPDAPPLPELIGLGVARISFGVQLHRLAMAATVEALVEIAAGRDPFRR